MNQIKIDLHIHSTLSPCANLEMSPKAIVGRAKELELDLIALTDHNAAKNCPAFERACQETGIAGVFGCEVTTLEELHCLCLFGTVEEALDFGDFLHERLPNVQCIPEKMGDQVWLNEKDEIEGWVEKYLVMAVSISLEALLGEMKRRKGLFIPAHIDRPMYSILSQLGYLPELEYDALEVVHDPPDLDTAGYPRIASSDSHILTSLGRRYTKIETDKSIDLLKEDPFQFLCGMLKDDKTIPVIG